MKSTIVAYLLWLVGICGCLGLHRFYLGKTKSGLLWLFSGGLLGIGSLIDFISLAEQVRQANSLRILKKLASGEEVSELKQHSEEAKDRQIANGCYCPYCMGILGRKPKRNINCPFCQKEIYVRPQSMIFENSLLTAEDALVVDHLSELNRLGIKIEDFMLERDQLRQKFGVEITSVDIFWSVLRQAMLKTRDRAVIKKLQRCLTAFSEDLGQDFLYILQRAAKMQLLEFRNDGFSKQVRIIANPDSCPSCRQLDGKIYTIEEALRLMPLPHSGCTQKIAKNISGFCRCSYQAENN
jgi:hypothetical protein